MENLTQAEYTKDNNVYQTLISSHNYINNYSSDLNKNVGYIHLVAKNKYGIIKTVRYVTLEEWQTLEISGNTIKSPTRPLNDKHRYLELDKKHDYYYSRNPLIDTKSRKKENIRGISLIMIDLDNENNYLNKKEYIRDSERLQRRLKLNLIDKGLLPNHTSLIFSGTGIQLIYEIKQVSPKAELIVKVLITRLSQTITKFLNNDKTLTMFKVDNVASNNISGLARLGGYNTKSKLLVTRQHTGIKYTLDTLLESLGATKHKAPTNKPLRVRKTLKGKQRLSGSLQFVLKDRIKKIDIYKRLQEDQGLVTGYRNTSLFLFANSVAPLNKEDSKRLINQFNKTFIKPLPQRQVNTIIKQLESGIYNFKNETFDNWLEIDNHNRHLFRTGQYKRKPETIRKQEQKEKQILELLKDKTLNNKQVAEKLKVNVRTVRRYRTKYDIPNEYKRQY